MLGTRGEMVRMTTLVEERVKGYQNFRAKIQEVEEDNSRHPIFVIFKAAEIFRGESWCPDVNAFEDKLRQLKQQRELVGLHLRVEVGSKRFWNDPLNVFRTDPRLLLDSVPTVISWRSGLRLTGKSTVSTQKLAAFFCQH